MKDYIYKFKGLTYFYYHSSMLTIFVEDEKGKADSIPINFSFDNYFQFIQYVKELGYCME